MRTWGLLLCILGWFGAAYFLIVFDASVATESGGRVNNIGLMADRQNGLLLSIGAAVFGVLLLVASRGGHGMNDSSVGTRSCPHCAEQIQRAAIVCRFCNRDVQADPLPAAPARPSRPPRPPWSTKRKAWTFGIAATILVGTIFANYIEDRRQRDNLASLYGSGPSLRVNSTGIDTVKRWNIVKDLKACQDRQGSTKTSCRGEVVAKHAITDTQLTDVLRIEAAAKR